MIHTRNTGAQQSGGRVKEAHHTNYLKKKEREKSNKKERK